MTCIGGLRRVSSLPDSGRDKNIVAEALSRKSMHTLLYIRPHEMSIDRVILRLDSSELDWVKQMIVI